jgi:phosphate transport system protein
MLGEKLDKLKEKLIQDATIVEKMIEKSIRGLIERDRNMLLEVIVKDEKDVNEMEIEIDRLCTDTIALQQPEAKDLRTVLMILKMNGDLERMGDQAVNICQSGLSLLDMNLPKPLEDMSKIAAATQSMIKDAIEAFINSDTALARDVCKRDDIVDDIRDRINDELQAIMRQKPETIKPALHLIRIASELERIADLSTNICEDTIFVVEGKVIKHHLEE